MRRGKASVAAAKPAKQFVEAPPEPEVGAYAAPSGAFAGGAPLIAICGRPNVGKSTLFNRLVGSRRAIVGDEPGITRDRLYGEANWRGRNFRVVDTGGVLPGVEETIPQEIFRQAQVALKQADAVVMVVDGRTELAQPDMELARLLLRSGKPLFLAVNKIDSVKLEAGAEEYRSLGIQNLIPIAAEHGNGIADLLDAVIEALHLPPAPVEAESPDAAHDDRADSKRKTARAKGMAERSAAESAGKANDESGEDGEADDAHAKSKRALTEADEEIRVAIIGHPNVGKSTLLNRITGTSRAIVSPIAGTTRDAVDEVIEHKGQRYRIIDTAGIRRKSKTNLMAEKMSVVMARKHLEAADIALMVIDATEGVNALDANIAGYAHESGRSVIIVVNKWDLIAGKAAKAANLDSRASRIQNNKKPNDQNEYAQQLRDSLKFLDYAPIVFISAETGRNMDILFEKLTLVAAERQKRISTSEMNRFLEYIDFEKAAVPGKHKMRVYYMTQAAVAPPTFILFTDRDVKLHFSYERYLENRIRDTFGFVGTPIWFKIRPKTKKPRPGGSPKDKESKQEEMAEKKLRRRDRNLD